MKKFDIKKSTVVNVSAEKVWEIIGNDFLNISNWVGGINASYSNPAETQILQGAPAGGRICEVSDL